MPKSKSKFVKSNSESIYKQQRAFSSFLGRNAESFERGKGYSIAQAGSRLVGVTGGKVIFNGDSELNNFNNTEHEQKRRIAVCREMYDNVGIVGNVIDLMVDFALEDLIIEHESPRQQNLYVNWAKHVDLLRVAEGFLKAYYRDGNVPIFKMRGTLPDDEVRKFRRKIMAEKQHKNGRIKLAKALGQEEDIVRNRIPIRYRILNALSLNKRGSEFLGTSYYEFQVNRDETQAIKSAVKLQEQEDALRVFREQVGEDNFERFISRGVVRLSKDQLDVIHYKKDDWLDWATPMLWRISNDVKFKQLLRDADISLAEGVVNSLLIVKLGNTEKKFFPGKKAFQKMVDMMKNPAKSKTIVWNDLIEIVQVFPPVEKMFSEEKYKQVNDDIRAGLGVPEVLINGTGGNFANSFLSVKTLLERLETGRRLLLAWIQEQFNEIKEALGLQKAAWIKMRNMSLTDEEVQMRFMLELADRNVISYRTLIERGGENFEIELQRMKDEDALRKEFEAEDENMFVLRKLGKFGPQIQSGSVLASMMGPEDAAEMQQDMQPLKKGQDSPSGQEQNGQDGGNPGTRRGRRNRENSPRNPQGQNLAKIIAENDIKFTGLYKHFVKLKGFSSSKEVDAAAKPQIYSYIIRAMSETMGLKRISKRQVNEIIGGNYQMSDSGAKLERCVRSVVRQRVSKFRKDNGKPPSAEKMKEITSRAFAICKSQGLK